MSWPEWIEWTIYGRTGPVTTGGEIGEAVDAETIGSDRLADHVRAYALHTPDLTGMSCVVMSGNDVLAVVDGRELGDRDV
jgi:hypothetical protein